MLNVLMRYMAECLHWAAPAGRGTCGGTCGAGTASAAASSIIGAGGERRQCENRQIRRRSGGKFLERYYFSKRPEKLPKTEASRRLGPCFLLKIAKSPGFFCKSTGERLANLERTAYNAELCANLYLPAGRRVAYVDPPPGAPRCAGPRVALP